VLGAPGIVGVLDPCGREGTKAPVSGGDVLRGVRPGMGCPLSVPQWTVGGLPGQPGGLGPWSGGGCGGRSSLRSSGVHSWASPGAGWKRRPTRGRASTAWQTAWSVAPGYASGRRGDGSVVFTSGDIRTTGLARTTVSGRTGPLGCIPSSGRCDGGCSGWVSMGGIFPQWPPHRCQPPEPLGHIPRSGSGGE